MPLRKKLDTLFNLSVGKFGFWFINSWKCGKECVPIDVQRKWDIGSIGGISTAAFTRKVVSLKLDIPKLFDYLPVNVFNEVVSKVAAAFVSCPRNRFCLLCLRKLLAVLLTKRLKRWDMINFFHSSWYIESYLVVIKSVLVLQIPTMKNIVHLRLGLFCNDSILRCIGENCHLIEYLNIRDSEVTDEGCTYLIPSENSAGCPKLQVLILGKWEIKISSHTVALLMKSLPHIVYINYYNMRLAILEVFDINELQSSLVLQLKRLNFIVQRPIMPWNFEEIIRLSKLCPNLEQLKIGFTEENDVLALQHFACLSQIHLDCIHDSIFPVAEVKQYFKEYCKQITSLEISCRILDTTCFLLLGNHCPNLSNLCIHFNEVVESEPFNRAEENNLKMLSTFTLIAYLEGDSNLVTRDLLYSLLKSTDRLTEVTLELPARCFSHQDLQFLLDVVDVHLLRSLKIRAVFGDPNFNLTIESVYLILEKCPLLKTLAELQYWDVVSQELDKLKRDLKYSNYDIQILEY